MDTLDYAILREFSHPGSFQWNVRLSHTDVGAILGVDEETVRQRVKRMAEAGILRRWSVAVHPALLGRRLVRIELPAASEPGRSRAMEGLAALGNGYLFFDFYGGRLAVTLYAEDGPAFERHLAVVSALWGAPPTTHSEMRLPPATIEPTLSDWKLIRALREDARAPHAALAQRAGLSERTVRRALDRLVEGRAIWLSPILEMERAEGLVPVAVRVFYKDPARRAPVDARLHGLSGIVFSAHHPDQTQVSYGAKRVAEADELRRELEAMPGVGRVETDIMLRRITVDGWMDEAIARKVKESDA